MAEDEGEKREIERAVCSRVQHFKDQADSLTLESVRRLLEKDLGLEKFALDAHKRFIRQFLEKKMDDTDDCNSKPAVENADKDVHINKEEATTSPNRHETKNNSKKSHTGDEEMMEDSPIMGVLSPKAEVGSQGSSVSESMIEKAISERADHFLANTDLTLAGVRRLLEDDIGLEKGTLDPFRKFISQQIDQVLNSPKEGESAKDVKKKSVENLKKKKSEEISNDDGSDSTGSESEEMEDKIKSRKEAASKRNIKKVQQPKKRKISKESDVEISGKKQKKNAKRKKEEDNDSNGDGSLSEEGQSQSSVEKPAQMKEKSSYGKQVENLKSIIKASGMSVAPSIYKKAKQVPENKREAFIVKELEAILSREGLSKNPTEKEIKDCRKRKDTARELEGIDMGNIISSSRRRSTFSFVAPSKPEIRPKKDKVDAKEDKSKDNNDKDQNDDNEEEDEKKGKKDKVEEEVEEEEEEEEEEGDDDEDEEEEEDDESEEFNEDDNEESD